MYMHECTTEKDSYDTLLHTFTSATCSCTITPVSIMPNRAKKLQSRDENKHNWKCNRLETDNHIHRWTKQKTRVRVCSERTTTLRTKQNPERTARSTFAHTGEAAER
jgi:hypothetical protein